MSACLRSDVERVGKARSMKPNFRNARLCEPIRFNKSRLRIGDCGIRLNAQRLARFLVIAAMSCGSASSHPAHDFSGAYNHPSIPPSKITETNPPDPQTHTFPALDTTNAFTGSNSFAQPITAPAFVSSSSNPAATGIVRLASTDGIGWRNNANNADIVLSKSSSDQFDIRQFSSVVGGPYQTNSSNIAAAGQFRLATGDTINWRNNANTADISLSKNSSDQFVFGGALANPALVNPASQHYLGSGTAPTCSVSGAGTGATCDATTVSGAKDFSGAMAIHSGTSPSASGTITLIYNGTYPTNGFCTFMLLSSSGSWNARATVIGTTIGGSSQQANWDNNAVSLTGSSQYLVVYVCGGS